MRETIRVAWGHDKQAPVSQGHAVRNNPSPCPKTLLHCEVPALAAPQPPCQETDVGKMMTRLSDVCE